MGNAEKVVEGEDKKTSSTNNSVWLWKATIKCSGKEKLYGFEMMCIRNICGIRSEGVRSLIIREGAIVS